MLQRSWVAAGALFLYLVGILLDAGWSQRQPLLAVLALALGYFLVQGARATWWLRQRETVASRLEA
jgi:hypothetical protein